MQFTYKPFVSETGFLNGRFMPDLQQMETEKNFSCRCIMKYAILQPSIMPCRSGAAHPAQPGRLNFSCFSENPALQLGIVKQAFRGQPVLVIQGK
ncbi:hypothetical protein ASB62_03175 [Chlorobium limicola]|uniref:Uncharacterized protein n=2 Tax=Chlorobium limicola TaxID=1092 RepID=A0A101JQM6_CHLLI|nr:hypothetical protein ASB62_03175 [Chlorobium limicola]